MQEFDVAWDKIKPNTSKDVVVSFIIAAGHAISFTSMDDLTRRGDYTDQDTKHPQSIGEDIADKLTYALASQAWMDAEAEPELERVLDLAIPLDSDPTSAALWKELLAAIDEIATIDGQ